LLLDDDDTDLEVRAKVNKLIDGQFPDEEKPFCKIKYCEKVKS
jgi:hypothetical protein